MVESSLFRRRLHRPRIPLEIHCGGQSASSSSLSLSSKRGSGSEESNSSKNKDLLSANNNPLAKCVHLLESGRYDDNRLGMEQLVILVNRELVNSQKTNTIAEALIFDTTTTDGSDSDDSDSDESESDINGSLSKRLRAVFPTFFYDENYQQQHWMEQEEEMTTSVDRPIVSPRRELSSSQQHSTNMRIKSLRKQQERTL